MYAISFVPHMSKAMDIHRQDLVVCGGKWLWNCNTGNVDDFCMCFSKKAPGVIKIEENSILYTIRAGV